MSWDDSEDSDNDLLFPTSWTWLPPKLKTAIFQYPTVAGNATGKLGIVFHLQNLGVLTPRWSSCGELLLSC